VKKIVLIDNYDSFTYNLVHYLEDLDCQVTVLRNDEFELDELRDFDKIVLSPGPGIPDDAGQLKAVIQHYALTKSILGVCLGQQAIGEVFGGKLLNLDEVFHGIASTITVTANDEILYQGLDKTFDVGRYHSWVVSQENFPDVLEITSIDQNGHIMSLRHRTLDIKAVQFHPESILTPNGKQILANWVSS
jgi:anthranilate synthase component 2